MKKNSIDYKTEWKFFKRGSLGFSLLMLVAFVVSFMIHGELTINNSILIGAIGISLGNFVSMELSEWI
jgi:hypothetical protein